MKEGRRNKHGGVCKRCGQFIGPGDGVLERGPDDEGGYHWRVVHEGECPKRKESRPRRKVGLPRWAKPVVGYTPAGHLARGMMLVDGPRPEGGVPVNDEAKAIMERKPNGGGNDEASGVM